MNPEEGGIGSHIHPGPNQPCAIAALLSPPAGIPANLHPSTAIARRLKFSRRSFHLGKRNRTVGNSSHSASSPKTQKAHCPIPVRFPFASVSSCFYSLKTQIPSALVLWSLVS